MKLKVCGAAEIYLAGAGARLCDTLFAIQLYRDALAKGVGSFIQSGTTYWKVIKCCMHSLHELYKLAL